MASAKNECMNYNMSFYDFFLYRKEVLFVLCSSRDHTKLILTSMVRLGIYLLLFYILWKKDIASYDLNSNSFKIILFMLLGIISFINLVYLLLVLAKNPLINLTDETNVSNYVANTLYTNKLSDLVNEPSLVDPNAVSFDVTVEDLSQTY